MIDPGRFVSAALLAAVLGTTGCVAAPTDDDIAAVRIAPSTASVAGGVLSGGTVDPVALQQITEAAAHGVLRVRNLGCEGVATGSGFAINDHQLVTNRHVVAGASQLTVETTDGRTIRVAIAAVAADDDLAVVTTRGRLPHPLELATITPTGGDVVRVLGFPLGGPLTISPGKVVNVSDGTRYGMSGQVILTSAPVRPGNSGGPLLDRHGQVIGVVFAIDLIGSHGLAIPVDRLRDVISDTSKLHQESACSGA